MSKIYNSPEELKKKDEENKTKRIISEHKRNQDAEHQRKDIDNFDMEKYQKEQTDISSRSARIDRAIWEQRKVLANKMTFVNEALTREIPLNKGCLYLVGGVSGQGKTTLAANVAHTLVSQEKKILYISNEETEKDILARVACLNLRLEFNLWRTDRLPGLDHDLVDKEIIKVMKYIHVIDVENKKNVTTTLEGFQRVMEGTKTSDYSCVIIDYWSNIKLSVDDPYATDLQVLTRARDFLEKFIPEAQMPVVLLAQLWPLKSKDPMTFQNRLMGCKAIYQVAAYAIEIVRQKKKDKPDETFFMIAKNRFGSEGIEIPTLFSKGRYLNVPIEEIIRNQQEQVVAVPAEKSKSEIKTTA